MKHLLTLLLFISTSVMAECTGARDIQTLNDRTKLLNHFLNNLDRDFVSKVIVPPKAFITKYNALNAECFSEPSYCFAMLIHDDDKDIKKIKASNDKEAIKYFKINNKLFSIKENLSEYAKLERNSNISQEGIRYDFTVMTHSLIEMAECSLK